ncbi:MAG: hypothetical protein A2373_01505 [Candidatus Magasanikbacteria bacterium RIFOXYB1_FULL_40_15]|nr:MAG: hypothetical protein A2224_02880 [Candidatus Magasanikbacteria bacterium RIFOXYA2_FULL_40_20]OGH83215.1 MAG: hypothetical protein A2373_01505 [Candidatus Magasanikbacteria bacterium RIFOXYB1_FULL_40_15]
MFKCFMSLNRLINLARRTGDRLIVHQPEKGEDIVIMDVDEYELLLNERRDVRNLSDKQLLDQINRDIAIWRANEKLEEDEDFSDFSEKEDDNWFSAGSVLGGRFGESEEDMLEEEDEEIEDMDGFFDLNEVEGDVFPEVETNKNAEELAKNEEPKIIHERPIGSSDEIWEEESLGGDEPVFYEEPV